MDNATGQASESTPDWRPDLPLTRSAHPTATISESPVAGVSAGRPATTGAQRGAALRFASGGWSDDEVWLKATTRYGGRAPGRRRTSGYISDEGKSLGDINVADGSGWPYTSDVRYLEAGGLLTPADYMLPADLHRTPCQPLVTMAPSVSIASQPAETSFVVTERQLADVVRRISAEFNQPQVVVQPSADVRAPRPPTVDTSHPPRAAESTPVREGRSMERKSSKRESASGSRQHHVRWCSPSLSEVSDDEFYDAQQSPSRARSSRSSSRTARSVSRDRPSGSSTGVPSEHKASTQPSQLDKVTARGSTGAGGDPGDDSDGKKSKPEGEKSDRRRQTPSPGRVGASLSRSSRWMKPDKFGGTGSVETFLAQFDICAEYNGWSDNDKAAHLKCSLSSVAAQLL